VGHDCSPVALAMAARAAAKDGSSCFQPSPSAAATISVSASSNSGAAAIRRALAIACSYVGYNSDDMCPQALAIRTPPLDRPIEDMSCLMIVGVSMESCHGPGVPLKALMPHLPAPRRSPERVNTPCARHMG